MRPILLILAALLVVFSAPANAQTPPKPNVVPPDEWGVVAKMISGNLKPRQEKPLKHVPPGGISVERGA